MSQDSQRPLHSDEPAACSADEPDYRPEIPPPPLTPNIGTEDYDIVFEDGGCESGGDVSSPDGSPENPDQSTGGAPPRKPQRRWLLGLFLGVFLLSLGFVPGYFVGWHRQAKTSYDPFTNYCGQTTASLGKEAMQRRNQIWRAWNGEDVDENSVIIAAALAVKLRPDLQSPLADLLGDLALRSKWVTRLDDQDEVKKLLTSGSSLARAQGMLILMKADAEAGEIIRQVLCDDRRIVLFLQDKPIPLETMPNGIAP